MALESNPRSSRSARLAAIMERLSGGELLRAEDLAFEFDISVRSIYRDMDTLKASGMPIEATQGAGYRAAAVTTLPPLHLTDGELEALHLGLLAIAASADDSLQASAQSLVHKLEEAFPVEGEQPEPALAVYPFDDAGLALQHLTTLRSAIRSRQRLRVTLRSGSFEDLRPLALDYWGRVWMLSGYGDTSGSYVKLAVHDIKEVLVLPGLFVEETGKGLDGIQGSKITKLH
ncbi:MAG: HTH domain-containing protein [Cognatishimia sp.]|uniref:helix-turn-helix transcriptional regulator n=1 Tax=Cognatishimia sp. TaxID=2211648 RepID=UPI003B8DE509